MQEIRRMFTGVSLPLSLASPLFLSLLLLPSTTKAASCFEPVGQGPVRAYSQCAPEDGAIILYINGTPQDNQSGYPLYPATINKMFYNLNQGTNTCLTRCLGPSGWYTRDTGSIYVDRSSTSTVTTSFVQGDCGTIKASGTATFSDYPPGWTFGKVQLFIDGIGTSYSTTCYTKTCTFLWNTINVTEGPHLLEVKTADSLAGVWTVTSSTYFNGSWPVQIKVNSPVGLVNKCNRVNVDYKFCYSYQAIKGYANLYFDSPTNFYANIPCYTESCNVDTTMPDLVGGTHKFYAMGISVSGNKYYNYDPNGSGAMGGLFF